MTTPITDHEGKKYLRTIHAATGAIPECNPDGSFKGLRVDVYCVLDAFDVTCPAVAHAVKKLLCPGERGKGSYVEDLHGAIAAINRAIELQQVRDGVGRKQRGGEVKLTASSPLFAKFEEGPQPVEIGADGFCACKSDRVCPIGKPIYLRCSAGELKEKGIPTVGKVYGAKAPLEP